MHFTLPGKGATDVVEKILFFLVMWGFLFLLAHVPMIHDRTRGTTAVILRIINKVLILCGRAELLICCC